MIRYRIPMILAASATVVAGGIAGCSHGANKQQVASQPPAYQEETITRTNKRENVQPAPGQAAQGQAAPAQSAQGQQAPGQMAQIPPVANAAQQPGAAANPSACNCSCVSTPPNV
ncbi:MAG: hypothetical protein ACXWP5_12530 [Bdellovibrionota bacterium]